MTAGLWFSAFAVSRIPSFDGDLPGLIGSPDLTVWVTVLLVQSIPYAAAVIVSIVSSLQLPGEWIGEAGRAPAQVEPKLAMAVSNAAPAGDNVAAVPAAIDPVT